jgi:hypothetical protein
MKKKLEVAVGTVAGAQNEALDELSVMALSIADATGMRDLPM